MSPRRGQRSERGGSGVFGSENDGLVPQGRIELPTSPFIPLRLSPTHRMVRSWSGLSLHPFSRRRGGCHPSSLYTFPRDPKIGRTWLGISISAFPEFERFSSRGFPRERQSCYQGCALPLSYCGNGAGCSTSLAVRPAPPSIVSTGREIAPICFQGYE